MRGKPIKVLLIEDDPAYTRFILEMLAEVRDTMFELEWADRLSTGLESLAAGGSDVVLLDLCLPDSWDLDTFSKTQAQAPQVPIIVLTGLDDETLAIKAVREGAQDYLVKGQIDNHLLVRAIRYAIERKGGETLLRQSEEKYRTLFEESKDVIFISVPEGKLTDINPAGVELFGYSSKEEFLEIDIAQDLHIDPSHREAYQRMIAQQGFIKDCEIVLKRKDGQQVIVLVTANAVYDEKDNIVAYRGIMRDITEHKQLERQFLQAQRMENLGTLAGGIAHDFNNLLAVILGYASFMKMQITQDHPLFSDIDAIERTTTRAAELTSQLLTFAQGGKYNIKPVNLNNIVNDTLKIINRTFDKSIEIETHLDSRLPTIEADAGQMQQAIMNLCINARDAMPAGGKLIIQTGVPLLSEDHVKVPLGATAYPHVTLSVIDNGIGMDKETVERIFDPFFTTKERGKGTGLGLSMVYGVIKNHGGYVDVSSEPGKGSTFKIYLPASGEPEVKDSCKPGTPGVGNELILVVDDEEPVLSLVEKILEISGYRVAVARNGTEAIEVYREDKDNISLVILDMIMPKMGGHETFLKLKDLNPKVRVLISTGYSQIEKAQEILTNGPREFIQKPYQAIELLSKVRRVLDEEQ